MPENENNPSPKKKKRGVLWIIIIILIAVLAATIGGYALSYYNAVPAWMTDMLPSSNVSTPAPELSPSVYDEGNEEPRPTPSPSLVEDSGDTDDPDNAQTASSDATEQIAPAVTAVPYIGADAAAEAALEHSKIAEKDADFSSVLLMEQNGMMLYEVVFTAGDYRYEYYIDSLSGRVESWKKTDLTKTEETLAASAIDEPAVSTAPGVGTDSETSAQTTGTVLLGEDEAKKLAMAHANITEKDISTISCKIELQGLNLIYEVDMKTQLMEYDYEIDAITGDIVGFDVEPLKNAK